MKEALTFFTAVLILAIAQILSKALGIVLLLFALLGAISHPRHTLGLILCLALLALALKKPTACVAALGAIGVTVAVSNGARRRSRKAVVRPSLTDGRRAAAAELQD